MTNDDSSPPSPMKALQLALTKLGHPCQPTGTFDRETRNAINAFASNAGMAGTNGLPRGPLRHAVLLAANPTPRKKPSPKKRPAPRTAAPAPVPQKETLDLREDDLALVIAAWRTTPERKSDLRRIAASAGFPAGGALVDYVWHNRYAKSFGSPVTPRTMAMRAWAHVYA